MASVIQTTGTTFYQDGGLLTLTKSGSNNLFVVGLVGRAGGSGRTLNTFTYGGNAFTVLEQVNDVALISQFMHHVVGIRIDGDISEATDEQLAITWNGGTMTENGNGLGTLLNDAAQSSPLRAQTGSGIRFQAFNGVPTDLTTNDAQPGDVIHYVIMNNNLTPGSITNFTQIASGTNNTGDTLLDEGATYRREVTSAITDETIPAPIGSAAGYHFFYVIKGAATGSSGSGNATISNLTVSGSGVRTSVGSGNAVISNLIVSGVSGNVTVGSGNATISNLTVSGSGVRTSVGSGNATISNLTVSGSGVRTSVGSGNATISNLVVSGTGASGTVGSGNATISNLTVSGSGVRTSVGSGNATISNLTVSGSGVRSVTGSGNATISNLSINGVGSNLKVVTGSGNVTISNLSVLGFSIPQVDTPQRRKAKTASRIKNAATPASPSRRAAVQKITGTL